MWDAVWDPMWGRLWPNARAWLWKSSSNLRRAHTTHASRAIGFSTRFVLMSLSVVWRTPGWRSSDARKSGCERYALTSSALWRKAPSKRSRDHWIVCAISLGKFFSVHTGIERSGGSRDEPYDSVSRGTTTCTFPLAPRVPLSSSGRW